jgi:hypothetical protein
LFAYEKINFIEKTQEKKRRGGRGGSAPSFSAFIVNTIAIISHNSYKKIRTLGQDMGKGLEVKGRICILLNLYSNFETI